MLAPWLLAPHLKAMTDAAWAALGTRPVVPAVFVRVAPYPLYAGAAVLVLVATTVRLPRLAALAVREPRD
jgi:hypothetical protein